MFLLNFKKQIFTLLFATVIISTVLIHKHDKETTFPPQKLPPQIIFNQPPQKLPPQIIFNQPPQKLSPQKTNTTLETGNSYCSQYHTPCEEGYKFENEFNSHTKKYAAPPPKKRHVLTLPYQDFYGWFAHWQRNIFSVSAIQACSDRCDLVYDEHQKADAVLFIMKKTSDFEAYHQVVLNVEPYAFLEGEFYASYFPSALYPVSYAFSETHVNPDDIFENNTKSWYDVFTSYSPRIKRESAAGVAWLSKSCDRHHNYLQRLARFISIDFYGPCFNNKDEIYEFPHLANAHRGLRKLEIGSHYKFYISLENTIIPHYVSEKFYQGFLQDSLMVYLGAPNADEYQPAQHSFINALHFESPERVGNYLAYLLHHPEKYQEHLSWKTDFLINQNLKPSPGFLNAIENSFERTDERSILCRICNKLSF